MSYWPKAMKVDPIGEWPGRLSMSHRRANFDSPMASTLETLQRESRALDAKNVRLQVAIPAAHFRLDGFPRSTANPEHPGIILTLESKHGALSYPCDTFSTWQDNLRAVALGLEALRKVDRYGVTKRGEQYRGFLAIEGATEMPAGFTSVDEAVDFIKKTVSYQPAGVGYGDSLSTILRRAKRVSHPDTGGTTETFQRVTLAEQYLKQNGAI